MRWVCATRDNVDATGGVNEAHGTCTVCMSRTKVQDAPANASADPRWSCAFMHFN